MVKTRVVEKRRWPRAKRVLSIQHRLVKRNGQQQYGQWHLSTTEDMSLGGLAFYTEYQYHVGDMVELKVVMSGILDIYSGLSQVVRVEKNKTAVFYLTAVAFAGNKISKSKPSTKRLSAKKSSKKRI